MKKICLSIIVILFSVIASGQDGANLKINLEKNRLNRLRSISEQTIQQTVNGNQQTIETKSLYTVSLKMVDATEAFIVAEVRIDTIVTKTNTMGKIVEMSSASEGNVQSGETSDVISFFMNKLSRNPLYTKLDFTGKVIEIVNSKLISDMILKDTSSMTLKGPVAAALKTQVINMVNDDSFKTIIEMFTYNLPGKMVKVGDNWSLTTTSNAGGMSLNISTGFHLNAISGNNAGITAESNIRPAPNAPPMESGGATITYDDLTGLSKSAIIIDIRSGLVIETNSKSHITGTLGVTVSGMNMQIPMDIKPPTYGRRYWNGIAFWIFWRDSSIFKLRRSGSEGRP